LLNNLIVDVNSNFDIVTAFGIFPVSDLLNKYVFEALFPSMQSFLLLRLPMKDVEKRMIKKLLKLLIMSISYKSKPSHERITQ